jgi:flagellar export protein FliJ
MGKFKFRFESIKNIKYALEKKVQKEIALVDKQMAEKDDEIQKLYQILKVSKMDLSNKKSIKISEVNFKTNYEKDVEEKINEAKSELKELKKQREELLNELIQKNKETKVFEALEEKHYESFVMKLKKQEQLEFDDIATKNFVRSK